MSGGYHGLGHCVALVGAALVTSVFLSSCGSDSNNNPRVSESSGGSNPVVFQQGNLPGLTNRQVNNTSGQYSATIRRTTNGVPHIQASNLEDAAFGEGYARAQDNLCLLAEEFIRTRSERAQYLGPGPGNYFVITDFSNKALGGLKKANEDYPSLSSASKAIMRGFAAGYNRYLAKISPSNLAKRRCSKYALPITPQVLYAFYRLNVRFSSGQRFGSGATFEAAPPNVDPNPTMAAASDVSRKTLKLLAGSSYKPFFYNAPPAASNGWAIGKDLTESGRGALLANPHFPYKGPLRFYQSQITIPGVMNVNGASIMAAPIPQIGFNQNVGWTHTVPSSIHGTIYKLQLKSGDPMIYVRDGNEIPITTKTFEIKVKTDGPQLETLKKTFYYSDYGLMISAHSLLSALPKWGDNSDGHPVAFAYRDANDHTGDQYIDQWLGMARSANLSQFQSMFSGCHSDFYLNTLYTDKDGNAYFIDGSAVPNLSEATLAAFKESRANDPLVNAVFQRGALVLLDGSTSRDNWVEGRCNGRVPLSQAPHLLRDDFVQNSNNSYSVTNPKNMLSGYSRLYGAVGNQLSRRERLGLTMLTRPTDSGLSSVKPAGSDGKFSAEDIIRNLYSDRVYIAETAVLQDLLNRCTMVGDAQVEVPNGNARSVENGCQALSKWDGLDNLDSVAAGTFRFFMQFYSQELPSDYSVKFDPGDPINTPRSPKPANPQDLAHDPMLQALAQGLNELDSLGIAYDAELGDIQHEHTLGEAGGGVSGPNIPWHGGGGAGGPFNIVGGALSDEGWLIDSGNTWNFGLEFTDAGPVAYGLMSYGQSADPNSPYASDQDQRYSNKDYRRFEFTRKQIESDPNFSTITVTANKK